MNGLFVLKNVSVCRPQHLQCINVQDRKTERRLPVSCRQGLSPPFVCGIMEPLEFCFIFAAPVLFLIHAVIAGPGFANMNLLGAHLGFSLLRRSLIICSLMFLTKPLKLVDRDSVGIALFATYYFPVYLSLSKNGI